MDLEECLQQWMDDHGFQGSVAFPFSVITENQAAVPSDRARAWDFMDGSWAYNVERYTDS